MTGMMARARKLIEAHIAEHGMVPDANKLIDAIASDLAFIQLASIPHRDAVQDRIKLQIVEWMLTRGYASGHGDTVEDLLGEIEAWAREDGIRENERRYPSYAASVWTVGDQLVLSFPSPLDAPAHTARFPNTEKGMALALETLREREREARSTTIGTRGAPSTYQVERALAEDKKYNEWMKNMGAEKARREAEKAEAEAFFKELDNM